VAAEVMDAENFWENVIGPRIWLNVFFLLSILFVSKGFAMDQVGGLKKNISFFSSYVR